MVYFTLSHVIVAVLFGGFKHLQVYLSLSNSAGLVSSDLQYTAFNHSIILNTQNTTTLYYILLLAFTVLSAFASANILLIQICCCLLLAAGWF